MTNNNSTQGTLLCLPQCDVQRPDTGASKTVRKGMSIGSNTSKNKSVKTTAKKADLVLFELPKCKDGNTRKDLMEGRCKILANGQYASLVTPSTSMKLVTVGTSNALVVWNKDIPQDENKDANLVSSGDSGLAEESPTKRRKIDAATPATVAPCRLIQPGGSGSSFLVGQPRDLDPAELAEFFVKRGFEAYVSTSELCNLFQVAPNQIWDAMLWIPFVVSKYEDNSSNGNEGIEKEEVWQLVPEEDVLFGQRALVETLCEEDDPSDESAVVTIETMAANVSQRLSPLLFDKTSSETENAEKENKSRCMAIARKTVLLSSSSSYSDKTKNKLNDFNRPFQSDASRVAFYALRDLFLKFPSYAWSDLSKQWSTRLPMGERYERITSTTEWIEDGKSCGHGGLIPNQLYFSSSAPALTGRDGRGDNNISTNSNSDETNHDGSKSKTNDVGNPKAVLSLVDANAVLVWRGGKR